MAKISLPSEQGTRTLQTDSPRRKLRSPNNYCSSLGLPHAFEVKIMHTRYFRTFFRGLCTVILNTMKVWNWRLKHVTHTFYYTLCILNDFLVHFGYLVNRDICSKDNKNLAIANRSRVSCAHNSLRASPWPWNLR